MANFAKNLLGVLSGGSQPQFSIDPTTGQTTEQQVQPSTGQMFKNMFAGMLTGLAGGVAANANGEHGALGALAGGYEATQAALQKRNQQNLQLARQNFNQQQEAAKTGMEQDRLQLEKETNARQQQESILRQDLIHQQMKEADQRVKQGDIKFGWDVASHHQELMDQYDSYRATGWAPVAGAPEYDTLEDAAKDAAANFKRLSHATDGTPFATRFVRDPATNKYQVLESDNIVRPRKVLIPKALGGGVMIEPMTPTTQATLMMNYAKTESELIKNKAETIRSEAEARHFANMVTQESLNLKDKNMISNALKNFDNVGGDGNKLDPSDRLILKRYIGTSVLGFYSAIQKANMDPTMDKNGAEYQGLVNQYHELINQMTSLSGVPKNTDNFTIQNDNRTWNVIPPPDQLQNGDTVGNKVFLGGDPNNKDNWALSGTPQADEAKRFQQSNFQTAKSFKDFEQRNNFNETGLGNLSNPQ